MHQEFRALCEQLDLSNVYVIDDSISKSDYCLLDLSTTNPELQSVDVSTSETLGEYVNSVIDKNQSKLAYGGYLEQRNIYQRSDYFNEQVDPNDERNIHLGVDLWVTAGTPVLAVLDGKIHSFQNNINFGDYGPTIIIEHRFNKLTFYSLYGHLSKSSLTSLKTGQHVQQGEVIATLGTASENGDYPPHLHFQIILDLQGRTGDYPGVCSKNDLSFYKNNCPNPALILGI
ncbi:MAG: peptidoglycan DD-metalloendopeptidase family protein [Crocinitomicaceae bacterium]